MENLFLYSMTLWKTLNSVKWFQKFLIYIVKIPEHILATFESKFSEFTQIHFTNKAPEYYDSRALIIQLSHLFRLPSSVRNSSGKARKAGL